jgi:hypothetical protein
VKICHRDLSTYRIAVAGMLSLSDFMAAEKSGYAHGNRKAPARIFH